VPVKVVMRSKDVHEPKSGMEEVDKWFKQCLKIAD